VETKLQSDVTPAAGSLKERHRQERVELILQTAEQMLLEKSYHEMSMDEIAARVGIAKGTIYLHFPGKEDLVVALFKQSMESYLEGVAHAAAQPLAAHERLKLILVQAFGEQRRKKTQLFISVLSGGAFRKETLVKQLSMQEYFMQLSGYIKQILEDGKTAGEFDATISTRVMLTTFLALLNRPTFEQYLGESSLSPEELADQVGRVYFQGINQR
jgi:AcrR family transcriptional regulator